MFFAELGKEGFFKSGEGVVIISSKASRKCTSANVDLYAFLTGASYKILQT
jgi:hypothetical protein